MPADHPETFQELISSVHTASLATLDQHGLPCCSYAPYVYSNGSFYLFLSGLAAHCRNLLANPACEIMLIEDEQRTKNMFARRRAMIRCSVQNVQRNQSEFEDVTIQFRQRFGPTMDLLIGLPDFSLFQLLPLSGTIVMGFGNALPLHFHDTKLVKQSSGQFQSD